ncbi:MAG: hypothetical protein ABIH67_03590 [Candidatus Uhrbacteria bacterium]
MYVSEGDDSLRETTALQLADLRVEDLKLLTSWNLAAIFSGCLGVRDHQLVAKPGHPVEKMLKEIKFKNDNELDFLLFQILQYLTWAIQPMSEKTDDQEQCLDGDPDDDLRAEIQPHLYIPKTIRRLT